MLILIALLRAVTLPLVLMATVVASYFASLGASIWVFANIFGFPGVDPSLPLYVFIFLVALGVDYNIFLMARAREETIEVGSDKGMMRALVATGGVITSAGLVLAGTFAILATLPLVFLVEIGFAVAFGVLIDALDGAVRAGAGAGLGHRAARLVAEQSGLQDGRRAAGTVVHRQLIPDDRKAEYLLRANA